jgi:hypothetical protein
VLYYYEEIRQERTKESYEIDARNCELELERKRPDAKFTSRGVKGASVLHSCTHFHTTYNTNIDYMHSVLEGVAKTLFSFWFEKAIGPYSFKNEKKEKKLDKLQKILSKIRPPSYVANPPKSLSTWKLWKANDFLSFFLFYAVIIFREIMNTEYYAHLLKFVISLEYLLAPKIDKNDLNSIQELLEEFVRDFGKLYSSTVYSSGTHELLHLVQCTLKFGPLNSTNGFPFEELNRKIVNLIHGKDLMGEEFIKIFSLAQVLSFFYTRIEFKNPQLFKFFDKHFVIKTSNRKSLNSDKGLIVKCPITYEENDFFCKILSQNQLHFKSLPSIKRCYYNGICYTDNSNESQFADYCVYDRVNQNYGLITKLLYDNEKVYAVIKKYLFLLNPFFIKDYPNIKSKTFICSETNNYIVSSIDKLEKCFYFKSSDSISYISTFRTSHLFN